MVNNNKVDIGKRDFFRHHDGNEQGDRVLKTPRLASEADDPLCIEASEMILPFEM